jgi:hypothetical protein
MFFGTPHGGSKVTNAGRVEILKLLAKSLITELPPKLLSALQSGADELFDLGDDFRKIPRFGNGSFCITSFYEGRETAALQSRVSSSFLSEVTCSSQFSW